MVPAKAYFPVPDFDHSPDKHIKLGQIIPSPFSPDTALSLPLLPLPEVDTTFKDDWEKERSRTISGSVGVWANFLAWILTLGGNVSVNLEREDADIFKFTKLETSFFVPDEKYIIDAMSSASIKAYLAKNPKTGNMFMITGIKIARGAEITRKIVRGGGGEGEVSMNAAPLTGVPVEAGPKVGLQKKVVDSESFKKASDFVFAYRLRKITIQRKTGNLSSKDFVKGAIYGVDMRKWKGGDEGGSGSESGSEDQEEMVDGKVFFDIFSDDGDFGATDDVPGFETKKVIEDEEDGECRLVFKN